MTRVFLTIIFNIIFYNLIGQIEWELNLNSTKIQVININDNNWFSIKKDTISLKAIPLNKPMVMYNEYGELVRLTCVDTVTINFNFPIYSLCNLKLNEIFLSNKFKGDTIKLNAVKVIYLNNSIYREKSYECQVYEATNHLLSNKIRRKILKEGGYIEIELNFENNSYTTLKLFHQPKNKRINKYLKDLEKIINKCNEIILSQ